MQPPFTFQELIVERAEDPKSADRTFAKTDDSSVTYREYARHSAAWAHLMTSLHGDPSTPPRVAVMMRNNLEFLYAYGGSAFAGALLFGINTGLSGEKLKAVINNSGADILITDETNAAAIEQIVSGLETLKPGHILNLDAGDVSRALDAIGKELGDGLYVLPEIEGLTSQTPWIVVYTSGTTGLPKGVMNNHGKVRGIGIAVSSLIGLRREDVGYLSMPLFHSNAVFLNVVPAMSVGAAVAIREKFTASGFLSDVRRFGATYWNYVGQPVHYVMEAISAEFGGDTDRIHTAVRDDPKNTLRLLVGTGASGKERTRAIDWLGLEHAYEN
jgi:fatty-acyl-CoA synthase